MKFVLSVCFLFSTQLIIAQQPVLPKTIDSGPVVFKIGKGDSSCNYKGITFPMNIGSDKIFLDIVEIEASYPGGTGAWNQYLKKNIMPEIPFDNGAPQGIYKVMVKFKVDSKGAVTDVFSATNNGYGIDSEVVRVVERSGNWKPAINNGRNVNAYRMQPVTFIVEDEDVVFTTAEPYIFYTTVDNVLQIKIDKVKDEDIIVSINNGTIRKLGGGKYSVKVQNRGKVIIEVKDRTNKLLSTAKFDVL